MDKKYVRIRTTCKYCGSSAVIKYGRYKAVPRYFCKACLRKFKADTAGFHMKVPSEQINRALNMHFEVISVSTIRETIKQETNLDISKSIIYRWIKRYTNSADAYFRNFKPVVGGTWIIKERVLELDGPINVWIYDVMDGATRFLLSSTVSSSARISNLVTILSEAIERSGKAPEDVILDFEDASSLDAGHPKVLVLKKLLDKRHIYQERQVIIKSHHDPDSAILISREFRNTPELISRFEAQIGHTKIPRPFKSLDSFVNFIKGWLIFYNYFKPQIRLAGRTPAQQAQINYTVKNWTEI
jgi:transposase-like protein